MDSTPKKRKLNQDEIPRISVFFLDGTLLKYPTWGNPSRKQCICWQWS